MSIQEGRFFIIMGELFHSPAGTFPKIFPVRSRHKTVIIAYTS